MTNSDSNQGFRDSGIQPGLKLLQTRSIILERVRALVRRLDGSTYLRLKKISQAVAASRLNRCGEQFWRVMLWTSERWRSSCPMRRWVSTVFLLRSTTTVLPSLPLTVVLSLSSLIDLPSEFDHVRRAPLWRYVLVPSPLVAINSAFTLLISSLPESIISEAAVTPNSRRASRPSLSGTSR